MGTSSPGPAGPSGPVGGGEGAGASPPIDAAAAFGRIVEAGLLPVGAIEPLEVEDVPASFAVLGTAEGEGDAEATRIYSQAYSRNPRFYKLLRTLESYKKIFGDEKTTAILSSDSELLRIMMQGEKAAQ